MWEKMHDKNEQKESLPMFIARQQAKYLLETLVGKGFDVNQAKIELDKILEKDSLMGVKNSE
jgi:hypothetical protein